LIYAVDTIKIRRDAPLEIEEGVNEAPTVNGRQSPLDLERIATDDNARAHVACLRTQPVHIGSSS